jgi:hypothetical protein
MKKKKNNSNNNKINNNFKMKMNSLNHLFKKEII